MTDRLELLPAVDVADGQAVRLTQGAAGTDLASLQGAMGGVGQACGSCHESYRAKEEGEEG